MCFFDYLTGFETDRMLLLVVNVVSRLRSGSSCESSSNMLYTVRVKKNATILINSAPRFDKKRAKFL